MGLGRVLSCLWRVARVSCVHQMAIEDFISKRALQVKESGIRRIFNLTKAMKNPIDFSIGQPDFDVPDPVKGAAIEASRAGHNGYTVTRGLPELREKIAARLTTTYAEPPEILVTSGVSGGLFLALMATLDAGDEVIFADPYFVSYPNLVQWAGGKRRVTASTARWATAAGAAVYWTAFSSGWRTSWGRPSGCVAASSAR